MAVARLRQCCAWAEYTSFAACSAEEPLKENSAKAPVLANSWSLGVGSVGAETIDGLVYDQVGNIIAAGVFGSDLTLGGVTLPAVGGGDVWVAKVNGAGGVIWAKSFGSSSAETVSSVIADSDGSIFVAGTFIDTFDPGTGAVTPIGGADIYVAEFDSSGTLLWFKSFGGAGLDGGGRLARVAGETLLLSGYFSGQITLGSTTLTSAGSTDVFLVRLANDGSVVGSSSIGGTGEDVTSALELRAGSSPILGGTFSKDLKIGAKVLTAESSGEEGDEEPDAFILRF
jgi:hypothetical protein